MSLNCVTKFTKAEHTELLKHFHDTYSIPMEKLKKDPILCLITGMSKPVKKDKKTNASRCSSVTVSPDTINYTKCMCRVWNSGYGGQCSRNKISDTLFCKQHNDRDKYGWTGIMGEPRPIYREGEKEPLKWKDSTSPKEPVPKKNRKPVKVPKEKKNIVNLKEPLPESILPDKSPKNIVQPTKPLSDIVLVSPEDTSYENPTDTYSSDDEEELCWLDIIYEGVSYKMNTSDNLVCDCNNKSVKQMGYWCEDTTKIIDWRPGAEELHTKSREVIEIK